MSIPRLRYLESLIAKKGNGLVKVVTGVRRCDKSYLLFNLFKDYLLAEGVPDENIVEVAFDEYESKKLRDPEVFYPWAKGRLAANGKRYVLLAERNNIRDAGELEALLDVLSSGMGTLTNPKRVSDTFRSRGSTLFPKTARAYIDHLIDAFVIEEAKRYDVKGRAYIGSPFKYYFCDLGLRNARMNFRQVELSHVMENVLYNELVGRGFGVDVGVVNAFSKNAEGRSVCSSLEVDFVCNKGDHRFYIQSVYTVSSQDKMDQELASLRRVGDSFEKIVVVRDPIVPRRDESGFLFVGIEDFLLDESITS